MTLVQSLMQGDVPDRLRRVATDLLDISLIVVLMTKSLQATRTAAIRHGLEEFVRPLVLIVSVEKLELVLPLRLGSEAQIKH